LNNKKAILFSLNLDQFLNAGQIYPLSTLKTRANAHVSVLIS